MPNGRVLESETWIIPQLVPFSNIPLCIIFALFIFSHLVKFFFPFFAPVSGCSISILGQTQNRQSLLSKDLLLKVLLVKTTGEGFCPVHWGSFPQIIRKSSRRTTKGLWISLKISWILSLDTVSVFFSILNSCNAIKSQFASQQKWLFFRNERNNRCVQLADEFLMCLGIFFHGVNSNYISSCA